LTLSCGPVDAGLYIDDSPALAATPAYVRRVAAIGLDHVAVMLDGPRRGMDDVRWSERHLARFADLAGDLGVARVATLWPEPTRAWVGQLRERLPAILEALATRTLELDVEGVNWTTKRLDGFESLDEAAAAVVDAALDAGATIEVVSWLARLGSARGFLPHVARLVLMTYPRRHRPLGGLNVAVPYDGPFGPKLVGAHLDRARVLLGPSIELASALPAWGQQWPGVPPLAAMRATHSAAVDRGVRVIREWSSKFVIGKRKNSYAERVLTQLLAA
jgi:hypothetical protein